MIKLIKAGVRNFRMTCSTCEAQYTYDIHDLGTPTNNSFVKCPCCGMANYHYQRDKWDDENEMTSCTGGTI